jgi:hypothetical protein
LRAGSWASDEPGRRLSAQINRYASDVEPLLIDYFEYWLDREPAAAGWREELRSLAIDKKNLDKGLQSRGARAVSLVEYARRKKLYDPIAHARASTLNYEKSHFDSKRSFDDIWHRGAESAMMVST